MKSKTVAQLLIDLGVEKTHSRPHVSNDNPYSESAFKTIKYHPNYSLKFRLRIKMGLSLMVLLSRSGHPYTSASLYYRTSYYFLYGLLSEKTFGPGTHNVFLYFSEFAVL